MKKRIISTLSALTLMLGLGVGAVALAAPASALSCGAFDTQVWAVHHGSAHPRVQVYADNGTFNGDVGVLGACGDVSTKSVRIAFATGMNCYKQATMNRPDGTVSTVMSYGGTWYYPTTKPAVYIHTWCS